ncbi:MAG TPA: peptidase MA family metallohydrolase [Chloroflexia bacterium]|nr:peptidase MA family metallohydrolase [Chloroflexia bacterium]
MLVWAGLALLGLAGLRLPAVAARAAFAAQAIVVDEVDVRAGFPTEVVFTLRAHAPGGRITRAVVSYQPTGDPVTGNVVADLTPASSIQTEARLDTRLHYMPPGVDVTYYWSLDDAAGHHYDTPPRRLRYEDTRYAWQSGADPAHNLRVHWYKGNAQFGATLRTTAIAALDRLHTQLGLTLTLPVEVWIYPDEESFTTALPPNLPEWVGGKAFAGNGVVLGLIDPQRGGTPEIRRIVPHELSHLVVYQAARNPYNSPPAWLDEGLAIHNQDVQDPAMATRLKQAAEEDELLGLDTLQGTFPADPEAAELSYAESASAVQFLFDRYGGARVGAVLAAFRGGVTYDEALRAGLGADTATVDAAWRASLPYRPRPLPSTPTVAPTVEPMPVATVTAAAAAPETAPAVRATAVPVAAGTTTPLTDTVAPAAGSPTPGLPGALFWLAGGGIIAVAGTAALSTRRRRRPALPAPIAGTGPTKETY